MAHSRASLDQVGFTPTGSDRLEALTGVPHGALTSWVAADGGVQTGAAVFDQPDIFRTNVRQMGALCDRTSVCVVTSGVGEWEPESPASRYSTALLCRRLSRRLTGVGVIPEYQPCRSASRPGSGYVSSILTDPSRLTRSLSLPSARWVRLLVATPSATVTLVRHLVLSHSRPPLTGSCGRRTGGPATSVATVAVARTGCRCPRGGC